MSLELKEAIADIEEKTNQKMLSLRRAHNGILKAGDGVNYGFQAFNICEEKYKQLEKEYNALKKNYKNKFNLNLFLGKDKITLYKN